MSAAYLKRSGCGSRASASLFESLGLQSTALPRATPSFGPARACPMSQRPPSTAAAPATTVPATLLWLEGSSRPLEASPASTSLFAALGLEKGSVPSVRQTPRSQRRAARQLARPKKVVHHGLLDGGKLSGMRSVGSTLTTMPTVPEFSDESSDYDEQFSGSSNP